MRSGGCVKMSQHTLEQDANLSQGRRARPGGRLGLVARDIRCRKTAASYWTGPLPDVVLNALSDHVAVFGAGQDGLIFTTVGGHPIRRNRFSEVWQPPALAVGLNSGTGFHALRHYYASLFIRHGASVKAVQLRLRSRQRGRDPEYLLASVAGL